MSDRVIFYNSFVADQPSSQLDVIKAFDLLIVMMREQEQSNDEVDARMMVDVMDPDKYMKKQVRNHQLGLSTRSQDDEVKFQNQPCR